MASSEPKQAGKWLIGGARRASASLHTACASSWWVTEGQVPRFPWLVCKRPYNQRLEGIAPFSPQKDFDLGVGMKERGWIEPSSLEPIVERVVGQVLEANAAQLRSEIVRRVLDEIAAEAATREAATAETTTVEATSPEPANHPPASQSSPEDLARAIAEIQSGSSQREILRALLDASARYASRVALFVVKGSHATGWQARGLDN